MQNQVHGRRRQRRAIYWDWTIDKVAIPPPTRKQSGVRTRGVGSNAGRSGVAARRVECLPKAANRIWPFDLFGIVTKQMESRSQIQRSPCV